MKSFIKKIKLAVSKNEVYSFLIEVKNEWQKDHALVLSAAFAYYTIISLPALLLALIGIASIFVEEHAVRQNLLASLQSLFGESARELVINILRNTTSRKEDTLRAIIGTVLLILGAMSIFGHLQMALNRIYGVKAKLKLEIKKIFIKRIITFVSFALIAAIFGISVIANLFLSKGDFFIAHFIEKNWIMAFLVNTVINILILIILFIIIFRVLPDGKIVFKDVLRGSFFTAILFLIGEELFTLYIHHTAIASSYGVTGSLIMLLLWIYYSTAIILLGAEVTKMYALKYGKGIEPDKFAIKETSFVKN